MAFVSDVTICSNALGYLGAQPINSLTDDTSERAQLCNRIYKTQRNELLAEHDWNFALKRADLVKTTAEPIIVTVDDFSNEFQLPVDILRVKKAGTGALGNLHPRYRIEGDKLYTDEAAISILYVYEVEDPLLFSAQFVKALEYKLAAVMAIPLTADVAKAQVMASFLEDSLNKGKNLDTREDAIEQYQADTFLIARSQF